MFDGAVNSWDVCGAGGEGGLMEVSRRNLPVILPVINMYNAQCNVHAHCTVQTIVRQIVCINVSFKQHTN